MGVLLAIALAVWSVSQLVLRINSIERVGMIVLNTGGIA